MHEIKICIQRGIDGDYYDSLMEATRIMSVVACGGYYEPRSNRDAEIGKVLYKIVYPEDE